MSTAIYVHDENSKINFFVFDPKASQIQKLRKKNRVFVTLEIRIPGIYEFHIEGQRVKY